MPHVDGGLQTVFVLFLLLLSSTLWVGARSALHCMEIMDAGIRPLVYKHIGIHFYVTVANRGSEPVEVEVRMVQCCEDFPGWTDCTGIQLLPETREMEPNSETNLTLIHPTLYPYDRRGECLLSVHYTTSCNRSKDLRQHVLFDTALTEENSRCGVLVDYPDEALGSVPCRSPDEDRMDSCRMVDCHSKYFGLRSYWSRSSRMCEAVPPCWPNKRRGHAHPPDIVYDVGPNQCRQLTGCLNEEDVQHLTHADLEPECSPDPGHLLFINCHHGDLGNSSGDCECQPGFSRAEMPMDPGRPRTQIFHSCNIDGGCWSVRRFFGRPDDVVLYTALLLAVVVAAVVLCGVRAASTPIY